MYIFKIISKKLFSTFQSLENELPHFYSLKIRGKDKFLFDRSNFSHFTKPQKVSIGREARLNVAESAQL